MSVQYSVCVCGGSTVVSSHSTASKLNSASSTCVQQQRHLVGTKTRKLSCCDTWSNRTRLYAANNIAFLLSLLRAQTMADHTVCWNLITSSAFWVKKHGWSLAGGFYFILWMMDRRDKIQQRKHYKIFPAALSITAQNWAEENQFLLDHIIRWTFRLILILVPS